ncbi:hypothetical protein CPB86DRAFT_786885 [Serendipita vermifera]|nr:hypothetical protein CPB86DRAFT_786885 [Serendipita vermifera]
MSVRRLIVDDADPAMIYSGSWTTGTAVSVYTNEYNSTYHRSGTIGDSVLFTFQGTGIDVYATLDRPATIGAPGPLFTIDNKAPVRFNETGDVLPELPTDTTSHHLVMRYDGLSQGEHTLNITADRVSSSGPFFYFDFVVVTTNDDNAPGYVIVNDRETSISYIGDWGQSGAENEFEHTTRISPSGTNSGSATFIFNGTEVAVYGATSGSSTASETAQIGFTIDGIAQPTFMGTADTNAMRHNPFLRVKDLDPKEHTLVITQLASKVFFIDYLVYKTSNAEPETTAPPAKKTNTGAIVGGVVGGVALIAIITIVLFFVLRKRQRRENGTNQAPPMKGAPSVTPYTFNQAPSPGAGGGVMGVPYGGYPSNPGSSSPPGTGSLGSSGAINAYGNPNARVNMGYGVGPEQDRNAAAYYHRFEGYNNANPQQQQMHHHSRSLSNDQSFIAGRPGEAVPPIQQQLPQGAMSPQSSMYTPSTVYSGVAENPASRGEKSGFSGSRGTIPREPAAPPYTAN